MVQPSEQYASQGYSHFTDQQTDSEVPPGSQLAQGTDKVTHLAPMTSPPGHLPDMRKVLSSSERGIASKWSHG